MAWAAGLLEAHALIRGHRLFGEGDHLEHGTVCEAREQRSCLEHRGQVQGRRRVERVVLEYLSSRCVRACECARAYERYFVRVCE